MNSSHGYNSKSVDGVFCAPCYLFGSTHVSNEFASAPFSDWKNAIGKARGAFNRHSLSQNHSSCSERAASFLAVMDKRMPIRSQLNTSYHSQVQRNREASISIVDLIQFMVKQGLPLRGHSWNKDTRREDGNLTEMISFVSKYSVELDSHIRTSPKNARYLSPMVQNEFITINGELIRKQIVEECNASQFWSVMVDESTDVSKTAG